MTNSRSSDDFLVAAGLLREFRERAGLTQIEVADRLEETQSYVSKCERGDRRIDIVQLRHFCRAMGVSLTEFVKEFEKRLARSKKS